MRAGLIDDYIRNILSVPFCPYHFVRTILSNIILSGHHNYASAIHHNIIISTMWQMAEG